MPYKIWISAPETGILDGWYLSLQKPVRKVCTQIVRVPGKDSPINPTDAEEDTGPVRKETGLRKEVLFLKKAQKH